MTESSDRCRLDCVHDFMVAQRRAFSALHSRFGNCSDNLRNYFLRAAWLDWFTDNLLCIALSICSTVCNLWLLALVFWSVVEKRLNFQKPHHGVAVLEHFHFRPRRDDFQRIAFRVAKDTSSAGREQLRQVFIVEQLLRE